MALEIIRKIANRLNKLNLSISTRFVDGEIDAGKIVASSYYGSSYSCNPKYITEALHRLSPAVEIVWLVNPGVESSCPEYVRTVRYGTLRAQHELATASVWLNNVRGPRYIRKKPGQFYIQTCHSSLSAKRCEADVADILDRGYVRAAMQDGSETDLMYANNAFRERLYQTSFWYNGPVVRCGVPRNKPLVFPDAETSRAIKSRYGLGDRRICLYAPTFRKDSNVDAYRFDYRECLRALNKRFGGDFAFCIRLHPNIAELSRGVYGNEVIDMTDYVDCQELLAATDVLISDYSSVLEDFVLTRRAAFVYAPDIDRYLDDRGFYYPLDSRPYPVARNEQELVDAIEAFSQEDLEARIDEFQRRFDLKDDGMGAEFVARIILEKMEKKEA